MSTTFASLRFFNYRVWFAGALVSNTGTWMQRVAQDWLVLRELTHASGLAVGIVTGLQFLPQLIVTPLAGRFADRFDRRRLLAVTQSGMGLTGLLLGLLILTGQVQLWHVYAMAFVLGVFAAFDTPARQTFVAELVPDRYLANAVGLNSTSFNIARLVGPAVSGLLIAAIGTGWVFLLNAASFAATVGSLYLMRSAELHPLPKARAGEGRMIDGVRYVLRRPDLMMLFGVMGLVATFGLNFQMTIGLMAVGVFHREAGQYGLLSSIMAVGSLCGALLAARRERPRLRTVFAAAGVFGIASGAAALAPGYWSFAILLVPCGLTALTLMTAANTAVQMTTAPEVRGRVMALYMAIFLGGTPLGSPVVGWLGQTFGARWSIGIGAVSGILAAVLALVWMVFARHLRVGFHAHDRPHLWVAYDGYHDAPGAVTTTLPLVEPPLAEPVAAPGRQRCSTT